MAQILGGRLPEGSTTLPEGFEIQFLKVTVSEPESESEPEPESESESAPENTLTGMLVGAIIEGLLAPKKK